MKTFLIQMQQEPYASIDSLERQEFAFALASLGQPVDLLFRGPGVLQLASPKTPDNCKDFTSAYFGLDIFDIKAAFVDRKAAEHYQLIDKIKIKVEYIDDIDQLLSSYAVVI